MNTVDQHNTIYVHMIILWTDHFHVFWIFVKGLNKNYFWSYINYLFYFLNQMLREAEILSD